MMQLHSLKQKVVKNSLLLALDTVRVNQVSHIISCQQFALILYAEQHELISSLHSAHFLLNTSVLFIDVCEIVIDAAVCARLISTQVEIETHHLTCSFCVCFVLCMLLMRILYL